MLFSYTFTAKQPHTQTLHPSVRQSLEALILNSSDEDSPEITDIESIDESVSADSDEIVIEKIETETMTTIKQIRILTLNDHQHQDSTLYRLEKDWIIEFRLGPSLFGRKIALYTNYPKETNGNLCKFTRQSYQLLNWAQDEGCDHSDDTACLIQIEVKIAGSFHYYFTYEDSSEIQGSGYFLVDPVLRYGSNEILPLDCIQCQTILMKCMGSFDSWESKLAVTKASGYNMIHLTPIQQLGKSNSSYSLSNQLKVNQVFAKENGDETTFGDIEKLMVKLRKEWKVLSICDIVLNHTANESEWIQEHPEVTYNCLNCLYMRPAYLFDAALNIIAKDIENGLYENRGVPKIISHENHLNALRFILKEFLFNVVKIHELYVCNVNKYLDEFLNSARTEKPHQNDSSLESLKLIQNPEYKRLSSTIDLNQALKLYNIYRSDCFDEETRIKRCTEEFKKNLDDLNRGISDKINDHLNAAIENLISSVRYFRVQNDGPKLKEITEKTPLFFRYFTDYGKPTSLDEYEMIMYSENSKYLMAHNGWVMNADPLKNFADPDSNVYLRRELIAWGDSVKLNYGDKPEDNPFLWQYMREYVEQTAKIFDGVRLDNCHSTPIPVAEYLLDSARSIKPDLYVVAELFTNSDMTDNIFVNRLGITSLIREAMSAWDSHEQGRLVYRFGGSPVGSFIQPSTRPLVPSIAHALFLDQTHDNPSPVERRSVFDLLPSTALVNMACCASGSNRGYDELVPHHIHVVDETRCYTEWNDENVSAVGNLRYVNDKCGIIKTKRALNDIHFTLGLEGYNQVYVDQMDSDVVAVTRHCPLNHSSYILVAFTAFKHPDESIEHNQRWIKPLRFEGVLDEIVLEATLNHIQSLNSKYKKFENFVKDARWINGLSEYQVQIKQHLTLEQSAFFEKVDSGTPNTIQLNFKNFKPGSVVILKVSLPIEMQIAVNNVRTIIKQFALSQKSELKKIIDDLKLDDLNRALYRCDQEERDEGFGFDTYNIPDYGKLVYSGLQGFVSLLANIRPNNDLGHPMCENLREGNWMIDYIFQRLKLNEGTKNLGLWIEENTKSLKSIPRYLIPCYFDVIFTGIYTMLLNHGFQSMSDFVKNGSSFVRGLSLGSIQFAGYVRSSRLPPLSTNLSPPKPTIKKNEEGDEIQCCVSLSAGLPHFSVGYMRNWGRDTFIAFRGLLLLTGRFGDARNHILAYASCLRHGLIPNLLSSDLNPRYNCRDAIWWWLYSIKSYTQLAPSGAKILSDPVIRLFPTDETPIAITNQEQPLHEIIHEALSVHFQGLSFRERNAGRQIDEHMTDKGFNNQIGVHPMTGFVFGGNDANCGTWMDKMGSSVKAGNKGKPATPRDGSAIEIVALCKTCVDWLTEMHTIGVYPHDGVERKHKNGNLTRWSFKEWSDKIRENFEKQFWIGLETSKHETKPNLINKKCIYKDCVGASQQWTDFQLRCNFPIAMAIAPELFNEKNAWSALETAKKYLVGPLGMKTLDPEDWAYDGNYDNSNDSSDSKIAQGFNYHQGPEWLWPIGYYFRARLYFAEKNGELERTVAEIKVALSKHFIELQTSDWRGLPELTNDNGSYCKDSSRTQAWSMSSILEVLYELQKIECKQTVIKN